MDTQPLPQDEVAVGLGEPGEPGVADVRPLDVTGVRTVAVGTALFLVATVVLLLSQDWLEETGREWWLWTGVTGLGLGLFGSEYCRRRARNPHRP